MVTNSQVYAAEIKFLKRKLIFCNFAWDVRPGISQVVSPSLTEPEANKLLTDLKDVLGTKAGLLFPKLAFIVKSKNVRDQRCRVAISVNLLRRLFADDIDGASGGGGRGYNPLRVAVTPRP